MRILVYSEKDIKKDGQLKKKNNAVNFTEEGFKLYVKINKLKLSKGYIDLIGFISNGLKFRCYYNNMVVGVTGIIKKVEQ